MGCRLPSNLIQHDRSWEQHEEARDGEYVADQPVGRPCGEEYEEATRLTTPMTPATMVHWPARRSPRGVGMALQAFAFTTG